MNLIYVLQSKKVNELGGTFIEFEFPEENQINKEKVNKLVKIIKEKQSLIGIS